MDAHTQTHTHTNTHTQTHTHTRTYPRTHPTLQWILGAPCHAHTAPATSSLTSSVIHTVNDCEYTTCDVDA